MSERVAVVVGAGGELGRAIDQIAAEVGPPEVLVNTIGTFRLGEAVAATPEDLRVMMDVNMGAAL